MRRRTEIQAQDTAPYKDRRLTARLTRATSSPDWNSPLNPQEIALEHDVGAEFFKPGQLVAERFYLDAEDAIGWWYSIQPAAGILSARRARRAAWLQSFDVLELPMLEHNPDGPLSRAEVVDVARANKVPAVLFNENGCRDVVAIVTFWIAREHIIGERRRRLPPANRAARVARRMATETKLSR